LNDLLIIVAVKRGFSANIFAVLICFSCSVFLSFLNRCLSSNLIAAVQAAIPLMIQFIDQTMMMPKIFNDTFTIYRY